MRYVLTKDFTKIPANEGILQNVSGDANIELTNDIAQQGILLKPFQTVNIGGTVYARRVSGGGTCALVVLPFAETATADENPDGETTNTETPATDTTSQTSDYYNFDGAYRYGGTVFVPVGNSVSTADKAVKDADGNVIGATYVKNSDKAGTYSAESDTGVYGVVTVGENITNTNGVISLSGSNVTDALGYTPLDSAEITAATTAQIDSLFE